jgi:putative ABC transport system ATP-binding protein
MIEIVELNRYFDTQKEKFYALKNINLKIEKGEFVVLSGVSGSGKTTLLSLIAGMDKPNSGVVLIDGEPIVKLPDQHLSKFRNEHIGIIFQHYNLLENLSVYDNVATPLIPMKLSLKEIDKRVKEALKIANISHKSNSIASRLSGGEKQRTAIARALVTNAPIILCDEPTANLDKANRDIFLDILKELHNMNKTIIVSTHDPIFKNLDFVTREIAIVDGEIVV